MAKPSAKRRKVGKQALENEEEYNKSKSVANSLSKKFKVKKLADTVPIFQTTSSGAAIIKNSENHDSTISRAVENHHNRIFQWEPKEDCVESAYVCALCHDGVQRESLGELFGPYYLENYPITKNWPTFLAKKPHAKKTTNLEVWFHGECILWAPNVHLSGNNLENLESSMDQFWSQHCDVCRKTGAAIPILNKRGCYTHYNCAKVKGFRLDEKDLTCHVS